MVDNSRINFFKLRKDILKISKMNLKLKIKKIIISNLGIS